MADGIMVGRACYGRPWFLSKLSAFLLEGTRGKDPDLIEQKNVLMNHIDTMFSITVPNWMLIKPKAYCLVYKELA